ncbi:hypothetical protein OG298_45155 (plasmid) [Streptomyces sp. NBC_01005]|uniref:hypothetical protein n=1 Tax=Streptomyces sp. NBC_01005 TaxID=2903715 RepID=UPI00386A651F|nr:hypothetical protein OG298_45155 [Streptomyces sp. NBC_01005]
MSDTERCSAAHADDPTPCDGPGDAVTILDGNGGAAAGCEHHGARMLASIDGARVEPGSVVGAATRVLAAADTIRPFCWYENAPRTEPGQLSAAENRARNA